MSEPYLPELRLMLVGGTIDKVYGNGKGVRDLTIGPAYMVRLLRKYLSDNYRFNVTRLMAKDSLDMTDKDRQKILRACQNAKESRIIISHGTDTMHLTAEVLACAVLLKTIILVGAGQPAVMRQSDADLNIGTAIGAIEHAAPGVYVSQNGVHRWNRFRKDDRSGRFTRIG